ncbi:MAG: hypothetical protein P4K93_05310 [Terracidiphilus sp.]|nr:hypothetical protein [Terracidiphilus sp.]MDR3797545.1 hypothetical protein [Terracidiphilus sp.]
MLLNKLESGFLLFKTQQGLVAVEPTFWQRVYLLWTFRNFRQLSLPLLNPRQISLINSLFRENATVVWDEYEPALEIGVVENFVPPALEFGAALDIGAAQAIGAALADETDASPALKEELPEQTVEQYLAPAGFPIAAAPAIEADAPPAVKWQEAEAQGARIDGAEIAPEDAPDHSFAPITSWFRPRSPHPASSHLAAFEPEVSSSQVSRTVIFQLAAAIAALSLCVAFGVAFHRNGAVPAPQAHSLPAQPTSPDSPSAPEPSVPEPTPVAGNPDPVPEVTPQAGAGPATTTSPSAPEPIPVAGNPDPAPEATSQAAAGPDAPAKPAPEKAASPPTTTHRTMTPPRASRGTTPRVTSRSSGGSHAAPSSRVPASASSRRTTSAPVSHGAMPRSAQSYFDLANQQRHKGNYAAAAADYKRAWRIQQKSAAKGSQVRARRVASISTPQKPH